MAQSYILPHNYTNNGRVFNMFPKRDLNRALIWLIPATALLFKLPLSLNTKLFWEILLVFPPAIAILAGYADYLYYILRFLWQRRVYYHVKEVDQHAFRYPVLKKAQNTANPNHPA